MLRLQQRRVDSIRIPWMLFLGISFAIHIAAGVALFFVANCRKTQHSFTIHQVVDMQSACIVLRPVLHTGSSAKAKDSAKTKQHEKVPSTRVIAHEKVQKAIPKKPAVRAKSRNVKSKKTARNDKKIIKTKVKPKEVLKEKKVEEKVQKQSQKKEPVCEMDKSNAEQKGAVKEPIVPIEGPVLISYADAQNAYQSAQLHTEVVRHWAPPPGLSNNCMCTIRATIDVAGHIHEVIIEQPSGILMFDITARSALFAVTWPRWVWGSSVTITFKP